MESLDEAQEILASGQGRFEDADEVFESLGI